MRNVCRISVQSDGEKDLEWSTNPNAVLSEGANESYRNPTRLQGKLNGQSGSFAMEDKGGFEGGTARSILTIIPGSGTGELKRITGKGTYIATQKSCTCELDYALQ